MKGSQLLNKAFVDEGIKYLFGYTGGAIMPVYDEINQNKDIVHIMARNEQGAAFMAQGLSRASISTDNPQVGVCLSTSGPGATNLVTGIADAYLDSIPILAITGQVSTSVIGTDAFQEIDMVGIMMPITKQNYMPTKPSQIEEYVHEALHLARLGRPGPVHIDFPKDIQMGVIDDKYKFSFKDFEPEIVENKNMPKTEDIKKAVKMINASKRPVMFCGHGVILSNSGDKLIKFAEKTNIPVATTLLGVSAFPADHPLHLSWMGMHGSVEANRAIQYADLIIAFGMRFDDRVTGKLDEYAKNAKVIHVEIDPSEINKNVRVSLGINADVKDALDELLKSDDIQSQKREEWFKKIEGFKNETGDWHDKELKEGVGENKKLLMKTIITKLSGITQGEDIVVSDVGQHEMMAAKYYNFQKTNSWFASGGAGTMGCAVPMSIGVKLARPDEIVWTVAGDGGFQMNLQELGVLMQYDIDINILVFNNQFLGMVKQWQTLFFDKRYAETPMLNPDFSKIAKAYGLLYTKVSKVEEIEPALRNARKDKGASITEFICDPDELVIPMLPSNQTFDKMIINKPE